MIEVAGLDMSKLWIPQNMLMSTASTDQGFSTQVVDYY